MSEFLAILLFAVGATILTIGKAAYKYAIAIERDYDCAIIMAAISWLLGTCAFAAAFHFVADRIQF